MTKVLLLPVARCPLPSAISFKQALDDEWFPE
jgi:hypothetical protein